METFDIYSFKLEISGEEHSRIVHKKYENDKELKNFSGDLASKKAKIYLATYKNEILYAGYTSDTIANRLRKGLNPNTKYKTGSHGYHGYKWKVFNEIDYYVCVFKNIERPITEELKWMFENIEAEIVFLLKEKSAWPKYQSEIHFYSDIQNQHPAKSINILGITEAEIAKKIIDKIKG